MRKFLVVFLVLLVLSGCAMAQSLGFENIPEQIRPGKTIRFQCVIPEAGTVHLAVLAEDGTPLGSVVSEKEMAESGTFNVYWDGTLYGTALEAGNYTLSLSLGDSTVLQSVVIGEISPQIISVIPSSGYVGRNDWQATLILNRPGKVIMSVDGAQVSSKETDETEITLAWNNEEGLAPGTHTVSFQLQDRSGALSPMVETPVTVQTPALGNSEMYPAYDSMYPTGILSYWTLPFDITNEEAIWTVLMQPMTVVNGKNEKEQVYIYAEPSTSSKPIAEVTCLSQGLRVISEKNGWSLVEGYSSSFAGSTVKNYCNYFSGYIETSKLMTKSPNTEYGIVIDKLTQRLYIFHEGKLFTTLLCSTGLPNERQPYNETTAGEFFMITRVGDFPSDTMICSYGMRFNNGDMMHEAPHYTTSGGGKDYANFQNVLGRRASHGCIRIQKLLSPEGCNAYWMWNNIKTYTKVLIWEDLNRTLEYPDDDTPLYYNPDGGTLYHSSAYCKDVKEKFLPLKEFTYGELDDAPYSKLKRCNACGPAWRKEIIDEINEQRTTVREYK